jgi:hypothetical protein
MAGAADADGVWAASQRDADEMSAHQGLALLRSDVMSEVADMPAMALFEDGSAGVALSVSTKDYVVTDMTEFRTDTIAPEVSIPSQRERNHIKLMDFFAKHPLGLLMLHSRRVYAAKTSEVSHRLFGPDKIRLFKSVFLRAIKDMAGPGVALPRDCIFMQKRSSHGAVEKPRTGSSLFPVIFLPFLCAMAPAPFADAWCQLLNRYAATIYEKANTSAMRADPYYMHVWLAFTANMARAQGWISRNLACLTAYIVRNDAKIAALERTVTRLERAHGGAGAAGAEGTKRKRKDGKKRAKKRPRAARRS